ncbi:unnamed protein product [marine sediment metagenome]|uniref:Uncharacterized protein n=1 Tax=marine sediment metagenome TaxID=412755 RepID=X0Z0B3_9ZZZZ
MIPEIEIHQISEKLTSIHIPAIGKGDPRDIDVWGRWLPEYETIKLQGYERFQSIKDISVTMNPRNIQQSAKGDPLYFMAQLDDGTIPDRVMWMFLIKMAVKDRAGRPPLNMSRMKPSTRYSEDIEDQQIIAESGFYGIPVMWHPDTGYNMTYFGEAIHHSVWRNYRDYHNLINSNRAISIVAWKVT